MGKLSDAAPYLAVAALAATGVGLAGAGAAGGTIAGTTAGATGALGAAGTQTGLALAPALATAPEAAFLASMGAAPTAVAPLATQAATTSLAPHLAGGHYGLGEVAKPSALQIGTGMEGVSFYGDAPIGANLDTAYAPIDAMTPKPNYAFGGRAMESATPQWMDMSSNISPVVEEGTKTLMDQLGIDKKTAAQIASQFYAGSMEAPPNYQGQPVAPTGRQRTYSPSPYTMAQIMNRTRSNTNRQIRRSTV